MSAPKHCLISCENYKTKQKFKKDIKIFFKKLNSKLNQCFTQGTYIFEGDEVFKFLSDCRTIDSKNTRFGDMNISHNIHIFDELFQRNKINSKKSKIITDDMFKHQYEINMNSCIENIKYPCKNVKSIKNVVLYYKFSILINKKTIKHYTFVKLESHGTSNLKSAILHGSDAFIHYKTNNIKNQRLPSRREDIIELKVKNNIIKVKPFMIEKFEKGRLYIKEEYMNDEMPKFITYDYLYPSMDKDLELFNNSSEKRALSIYNNFVRSRNEMFIPKSFYKELLY